MVFWLGMRTDCSRKPCSEALHMGLFSGHEPTVRLLQRRGADVRAVDAAKRRTALEWAVFNNHRKASLHCLASSSYISPEGLGLRQNRSWENDRLKALYLELPLHKRDPWIDSHFKPIAFTCLQKSVENASNQSLASLHLRSWKPLWETSLELWRICCSLQQREMQRTSLPCSVPFERIAKQANCSYRADAACLVQDVAVQTSQTGRQGSRTDSFPDLPMGSFLSC